VNIGRRQSKLIDETLCLLPDGGDQREVVVSLHSREYLLRALIIADPPKPRTIGLNFWCTQMLLTILHKNTIRTIQLSSDILVRWLLMSDVVDRLRATCLQSLKMSLPPEVVRIAGEILTAIEGFLYEKRSLWWSCGYLVILLTLRSRSIPNSFGKHSYWQQ
jgi:hypothetical protein